MLLLKTAGEFEVGKVTYNAKAGSAFLYKKGTPQLYRACEQQFGNDWFHFLPDNREDEAFLKLLDIPFDRPIKLESIAGLSVLVSMMCREHYSQNTYRIDSSDLLIKLFFIKLSEGIHKQEVNNTGTWHDRLSILRSKIYSDPANDWSIEWLSHELAISHSSLQHMYKKLFGVTPMNDVILARVEHAKYLLRSTDYTVIQIAQMCGYASDIHFMRQFKQKTGLTPSQFRKQASKQQP